MSRSDLQNCHLAHEADWGAGNTGVWWVKTGSADKIQGRELHWGCLGSCGASVLTPPGFPDISLVLQLKVSWWRSPMVSIWPEGTIESTPAPPHRFKLNMLKLKVHSCPQCTKSPGECSVIFLQNMRILICPSSCTTPENLVHTSFSLVV